MRKDVYKALANKTRVKILACLSTSRKSVTAMIDTCSLSQSAVSQHLQYLKDAGLITATRNGRQQLYTLTNKNIGKLCTLLLKEISHIENE